MADFIAGTTQQSLIDFESIKDNFPGITERGADDYAAKGRDLLRIVSAINNLAEQAQPQDGIGSPEGVVTSNISKQYVDTATNQLYFNPVLGVNTGWVLIS